MKRFLYIPILLSLIFFTVLIYFHSDDAINQDLGRHLLLGKIIWKTKQVPSTNLFSYTFPEYPFINHHWGSEVIFFLVQNFGSFDILILFKVIVCIIAFAILLIYGLINTGNPLFVFASGILSLEILRERTHIRPEIFGYLCFSLFLVLLYREKKKPGNSVWLLLPLFVFWINTHVTFIFGFVLLFCFLVDRLILKRLSKKLLVLSAVLFACSLLNPNGITGVLYPFRIFSNYGYQIVENQSVLYLEHFFDRSLYPFFKIALICSILMSVPLLIQKKIFESISLITLGILSFVTIRHFPFFALSFIIPFASCLDEYMYKVKVFLFEKKNKKFQSLYYAVIALSSILLFCFLVKESIMLFNNSYYKNRFFPQRTGLGIIENGNGAVNYFIKHQLSGPIFNNFDIGSYLSYRLYPKELVFVDSRPEAYPSSFFADTYIPMQKNESAWKQEDAVWNFKTILFSHTDLTAWAQDFLLRLTHDSKWDVAYFDEYAVVLVKHGSFQNMKVFDSKEKIETYARLKITQIESSGDLIHFGQFLRVLGYPELEKEANSRKSEIL